MIAHERAADAGTASVWVLWFMSHLDQVNGILQFIVLIGALISTGFSLVSHWRKRNK